MKQWGDSSITYMDRKSRTIEVFRRSRKILSNDSAGSGSKIIPAWRSTTRITFILCCLKHLPAVPILETDSP